MNNNVFMHIQGLNQEIGTIWRQDWPKKLILSFLRLQIYQYPKGIGALVQNNIRSNLQEEKVQCQWYLLYVRLCNFLLVMHYHVCFSSNRGRRQKVLDLEIGTDMFLWLKEVQAGSHH